MERAAAEECAAAERAAAQAAADSLRTELLESKEAHAVMLRLEASTVSSQHYL